MPKLGIVIPIYDVEPYLRQCLNSVISQALNDIEIVLVDDGSSDGCSQICDEYAIKDERVKVIHKPNEGLAKARNIGIDATSAPYIMFVDADDWMENNCCDKAYNAAINNNADIVLFAYRKIFSDGRIENVVPNLKSGILSQYHAMRFNSTISKTVWVGLYKKNLFEDVHFPVGKCFEDIGTTYRLIHGASRIFFINECLYNYRINRVGSITERHYNNENPDWREMNVIRIKDLYNWGFGELVNKDAFSLLIKYGREETDQEDLARIVMKTPLRSFDDFSIKQMIMLALFKTMPKLFDSICIATGRRKHS